MTMKSLHFVSRPSPIRRLLLFLFSPITSLISPVVSIVFYVFPFLKRHLEERQVVGWRAEQEALKRKLVIQDTEEWQRRIWEEEEDEEERNEGGEGSRATEGSVSSTFSSGNLPVRLQYVGGVDVSFAPDGVTACASIVVCDLLNDLSAVYEDFLPFQLTMPYRPGFLAFREAPALMTLWRKLISSKPEVTPQVVLIDGNGILHPHGFGSASHFGVLIDTPTIGVAKKLYHVDGLEKSPAHKRRIDETLKRRHDSFELIGDSGAVLGMALRTGNDAKNPVYVSVGHRISLATALEVVKRCSLEFRVPEPIRQADIKSREWLRES